MNMVNRSFIPIVSLLLSFNSFAASPAARFSDSTSGGGSITQGSPTVFINGLPAARVGDQIVTPRIASPTPLVSPTPCVGGPIITGSVTVVTDGLPTARLGDLANTACGPETIVTGSPTVFIR